MAKKKRKRTLELGKRCRCTKPDVCAHDWFLRVFAHGKRARVNLTERFTLARPMARKDVEVFAVTARDSARRGQLHEARRGTLGSAIDRYIDTFGDNHYIHALDKFRDVAADKISAEDIEAAEKAWFATHPRAGKGSRRHVLQTARHMFNWAIQRKLCHETPFRSAQGVPLIKVPKAGKRKRRLEAGEAERIVAVASDYIKDIFTAMTLTGCRPGELRTLQFSEVRDRIVILAEKAKDHEERSIPILPDVAEILARRRLGPDGNALPDSAYVFGSATGEMVKRRQLIKLWTDTCAATGIVGLHMHDLRAEFGSRLSELGAPLSEIRDALGHSSVTMTDTYLRSRLTTLDSTYNRLRIVPRGPIAERKKAAK